MPDSDDRRQRIQQAWDAVVDELDELRPECGRFGTSGTGTVGPDH